mgnify:FL=1
MLCIGICDDNRESCSILEEMLVRYQEERHTVLDIHVWYTGEALCDFLERSSNTLDALFLDINLDTTDGIQVGNFIREKLDNYETKIVYISADSSYAMELFRQQPIAFLIKPLRQEKVSEVMEYIEVLNKKRNGLFEYYSKGLYFKVPFKDIRYFSSQNKSVHVILKAEERIYNGKLKDVASYVPENFVQIHQSYLVNFDHVLECTAETVKLTDGTVLPISQPYRKAVRAYALRKARRGR